MLVPDLLVVSELFPPAIGGSAVLLSEIYRRLHGHSVSVLTDETTSPGPDGDDGHAFSIQRRAIATRAWGLVNPAGALHHFEVGVRIRRMTNRRRSVVHCGRAIPEGIAAWMSRQMYGAPYVVWCHGEDISTALTSRELTWVMTRVVRGAAAVIANSLSTRGLLLPLGIPEERIHVVYPGVDPDRFHPGVDGSVLRRSLLRGGNALLLSVGRLQRRKGHDLVIDAMARLKSLLPGLRYVIVGDGEEKASLERLVLSHGLADRVTFVGAVSDNALPAYFAACDVFAMPNRREGADIEGFGIVFLEAAASGKPAIGGNSGGAPEAIDPEKTGLLVSGHDAGELADAVARLSRNAGERAAFGSAARTRVLARFTWEHAAAKVAAIHAAVAAGT